MSNPAISVIVPIYNAEGTVSRCVESILNQSFSNFELILVDDGSTDGSLEKCNYYSAQYDRIKVISQKNGGASSARNKGLETACGDYVCFADADDYVTPIWLDSLFHAINEHPNSLVIQNVLIEEPSRTYLRYENLEGVCPIEKIWQLGSWGYSINKIFRRDIIERQGLRYDESLKVFEDELFIARYSSTFKSAYVIPTIGYHYINTVLLAERYKDSLHFNYLSYQYKQVRRYNRLCSQYLVDRILFSAYTEMKAKKKVKPYALMLKEVVGKDIRYVCGHKKFLIRTLHLTNNSSVWNLVFNFYLRFNLI